MTAEQTSKFSRAYNFELHTLAVLYGVRKTVSAPLPSLMNARTLLQVAESSVHGLGAFMTQDVTTAALLGVYQGRRYSPKKLSQRCWDDGLTFLFSLSNGDTIDGSRGGNATRRINHSCAPNCEAVEEFDARGRLVLKIYALGSLRAGDEVFLDYGLIVDESSKASDYPCCCGASTCRGSMVAQRRVNRSADES